MVKIGVHLLQVQPPRVSAYTLYFQKLESLAYIFCRCMYGSIFIQFCAVPSKARIFSAPEGTGVRFGHSRLSKVDDFGTNRKRMCDFLLVGHCNYGSILHRFWDTTTYWLKIAFFVPLFHSAPSLPMFPLEFWCEVNPKETRVMGLSFSEDPMILAWVVLAWYQRVTDRQTDRRNLS